MSETIQGFSQLLFQFQQQSTGAFSTTFKGTPRLNYVRQYATTDLGICYCANYSVNTTPTVIDLTSLTDAFGQAVSFATVKGLVIVNNDTTNNLTAGGGTNPVIGTMPVLKAQAPAAGSNGSALALNTLITVGGSTKNLALVSSAGTISVDVFIVGS